MPHIVQSATGEMIDLDMLKIKAALAENVINLEIKKNSAFIEDPEKTAIVNNELVDINSVIDSLPEEIIEDKKKSKKV